MRYETLPQIEARFRNEAAPFLSPFSVPVPNESLTLNGLLYKPNRSNYYYETKHPKQRIVLHFTAGNVRSDMYSLTTQNRHVSVAFVIGRDGTIYQLYHSGYWSGHIGAGIGNQGTGNSQDKATIGIEISNYGFLVPRDGVLETIYSRVKNPDTGVVSAPDPYCSLNTTEAYNKTDAPFRGQSYYASFTPEQVESTIVLLRYLTSKYNIPRQFLPEDKRFLATNDVLGFKGIVSHINYRSSGKWDIGPAFDWNTLISGVQAASFTPSLSREATRELVTEKAAITDEDALLEPEPAMQVTESIEEATDNEGYNPNNFEEESLEKELTPGSGKVYALLAGINNYDRVRKLNGCLEDIKRVKEYLERRTTLDCKVKTLLDDQASRTGIAKGFEEHLGQAGKDDTVLFYFSGHGTREEADPLWDETDQLLECLVCHDGGTTRSPEFLLTDKELRYLLAELYKKTQAHIVVICDCCHSGDNTRGALVEAAFADNTIAKRMIVTSRVSGAFEQRQWSDFIFSSSIKKEDIAGKKPGEFLPEGQHIQIAACESDQSAMEVNGEGVFTKQLLAALDASGGNLSYNVLRNRIRQYLRFTFEQTPRIYASGKNAAALLAAGFLNRPLTDQTVIAEATYNSTKGWQLNIGAIHGVTADSKVAIINTENAQEKLKATIKKVFIDYSIIAFTGNLSTGLAHKAEVAGLMSGNILLELNNWNGHPKEMDALLEDIRTKTDGHFEFESSDNNSARRADYTVHIRAGEAVITRPGDPYRPLVQPQPLMSKEDNAFLLETLKHMSQWHFIKQLQNADIPKGFPAKPLKIEVTRVFNDGSKKLLDTEGGTAILQYEEGDKSLQGALQIQITNTTKQDLYVAAIYLDVLFQSFLDFLPQRTQKLEAGASLFLQIEGDDLLRFELSEVAREYNWPEISEFLKFIVSTEEFNAESLVLEALPRPYILADKDRRVIERSLVTRKNDPVQFSGWITQTLSLIQQNPLYNHISKATAEALMDYEETAFYAAGLYYDVTPDENGEPSLLSLKKELVLPEGERGILGDFKLWAANTIETLQRKRLYKKLKNTSRTRIVAEGDSWFQYPILVQDILDHLYRLYAIRSFAEAGDTMENYMKEREYVDPIAEEQAIFYLVSGGGNDILGKQFRGSLRDTPDPNDATPRRYLNETFFDKLDMLEAWYKEMFTELKIKYPHLRILTHSYDYIIPIDTEMYPKKTSWLGVYMIEKGIKPQAEREALIRFMVDEFNTRLKNAVKAFPDYVSYINVRGLVARNSWYDEIHPTNDGFKLVADRFVAEIERLKAGLQPIQELAAGPELV